MPNYRRILDQSPQGWVGSDALASEMIAAAVPPSILIPPASVFTSSALGVWAAQYFLLGNRVYNPVQQTYRWINYYQGVSSGNMQCGVARLDRTGLTQNLVKVMDSGIIACPAANAIARIDCGATVLPPGDYVLFLWFDNTTASVPNGILTGLNAARIAISKTLFVTGLTAASTPVDMTARWITGITLETDS